MTWLSNWSTGSALTRPGLSAIAALTKQQAMAEQHSAEIRKLYRGIRGLIVLGFSVAAIAMLVYGFLRLEKDNRTDLISLLGTVVVPVILGASALLVKNKTTP
jgi:hypothetical protein